MADEIQVTTALRVSNGNLLLRNNSDINKFDQTTALASNFSQTIGTSEETISFGDVTPGFVRMTNLDATNYVQIGFATGVYNIRLLANKGVALFYLESGQTIYAIANTASCNVQIEAINT